jgi:hypothetical protein
MGWINWVQIDRTKDCNKEDKARHSTKAYLDRTILAAPTFNPHKLIKKNSSASSHHLGLQSIILSIILFKLLFLTKMLLLSNFVDTKLYIFSELLWLLAVYFLKEEGLISLLLKILCPWNICLGFLLLAYNAKFHLTFRFNLAMLQIKFLDFIQKLVMEWSKWNRIIFHYEIDNNLLQILNLKILHYLRFLNSYPLLLKVGHHIFLLKVHLHVLPLKVSHQFAFYAFFILFSYDFSSCCYLVMLEFLFVFQLG